MARGVLSLRVRVIVVALVVAIAPVLVVAGSGLLERNIGADMRARLEANAVEAAMLLDDGGAIESEVADSQARTHSIRLRIVASGTVVGDADFDRGADSLHQVGQLFFGPDGAPTLAEFDATLGPLEERPEVLDASAGRPVSGCRTSPGGKLLVCHAVVQRPEGTVIYAQESSRRAVRALYDLRYQLLRLTVAMTPIAIALALLLGRGIVKPIRALAGQARARAEDPRPMARLDEVGDAEIRELARSFNELLERLDERQRQNETFTADLVHEIKNPLATVRAAADAIEGGKLDGARAARLARSLRAAGSRLDAIVTQFLELARAEGGLSAEERTDVDVAALARTIAEASSAAREDVVLDIASAPEPVVVRGVVHSLDAAIRNLVENAFSFAGPRDGRAPFVAVAVVADEGWATIRVEDSGPGIPEAELSRVFERFFTSRGRGRGTGLGLALVKATVEAHGGTVTATSDPRRGATFVVRIPLMAAST
ncbi:MAG: HAMP domain-containing histidine kinase [Polyangiaceae bacterium]|nr:HAMP domain-containing histidine kinase [Polyangiaceae bacterium]